MLDYYLQVTETHVQLVLLINMYEVYVRYIIFSLSLLIDVIHIGIKAIGVFTTSVIDTKKNTSRCKKQHTNIQPICMRM